MPCLRLLVFSVSVLGHGNEHSYCLVDKLFFYFPHKTCLALSSCPFNRPGELFVFRQIRKWYTLKWGENLPSTQILYQISDKMYPFGSWTSIKHSLFGLFFPLDTAYENAVWKQCNLICERRRELKGTHNRNTCYLRTLCIYIEMRNDEKLKIPSTTSWCRTIKFQKQCANAVEEREKSTNCIIFRWYGTTNFRRNWSGVQLGSSTATIRICASSNSKNNSRARENPHTT